MITPKFPKPAEPVLTWIPTRAIPVKVHLGMRSARNAVTQMAEPHGRTRIYPEAHIYVWAGARWVEVHHIEKGDDSVPWGRRVDLVDA